MTIKSRLAKLEAMLFKGEGAPAVCPKCRVPTDLAKAREQREWTVEWDDGSPPSSDEVCSGCGRRSVYRIEFDKGG